MGNHMLSVGVDSILIPGIDLSYLSVYLEVVVRTPVAVSTLAPTKMSTSLAVEGITLEIYGAGIFKI